MGNLNSVTMDRRNVVIDTHVREYMHHTAMTMESFADTVVNHYYHRTHPEHRTIKFHDSGDAWKMVRANAQIIRRFLDDDVRLPCELEESIVLALPDDRRKNLLAVLAARYGLLAVPLPDHTGAQDFTHVGELVQEFGEAMQALAPALADGKLGPEDAKHAQHILNEVNDVQAILVRLQKRVIEIMPGATVVPLKANQ